MNRLVSCDVRMRSRKELKLRINAEQYPAASRTIVAGGVPCVEAVRAVCSRLRDVLPAISLEPCSVQCHRKLYKMLMLRQYVVGQQVFLS